MLFEKILPEIQRTAGLLHQKGWAEASAGNLSYVIPSFYYPELNTFGLSEKVSLPQQYSGLSDKYIFISGSGKRMRDLAIQAFPNLAIIRLNDNGSSYSVVQNTGLKGVPFKPTSELFTHLSILDQSLKIGQTYFSVLHAHITEAITLSHHSSYQTEEAFNSLLRSVHPEFLQFLPEGIGYINFVVSGDQTIADLTLEKMKDQRVVIWENHGVVVKSVDIASALDLMEILAKGCQIVLNCLHAGFQFEGIPEKKQDQIKPFILQ